MSPFIIIIITVTAGWSRAIALVAAAVAGVASIHVIHVIVLLLSRRIPLRGVAARSAITMILILIIITADAIIIAWPAAAEGNTDTSSNITSYRRRVILNHLALTLILTLHLMFDLDLILILNAPGTLSRTHPCLPTPTPTRDNARTSSAWTAAATEEAGV